MLTAAGDSFGCADDQNRIATVGSTFLCRSLKTGTLPCHWNRMVIIGQGDQGLHIFVQDLHYDDQDRTVKAGSTYVLRRILFKSISA